MSRVKMGFISWFLLSSLALAHTVSLSCTPPNDPTVTRFRFYRSLVSGKSYTQIGYSSTCAFVDAKPVNGTTYYYVVRSVRYAAGCPTSGCVSPKSTEVKVTIPSV